MLFRNSIPDVSPFQTILSPFVIVAFYLHILPSTSNPKLQHLVAQKDIEFSNSMIESANKNLKNRFLYHQHIPDFNSLCQYLPRAIEVINNRPYDVLSGLTPLEILNGKIVDKNSLSNQMRAAKAARISENKL